MSSLDRKTIKLYGGPQDGSIIVVPYSEMEYIVTIVTSKDEKTMDYIYRQTGRRTGNGEIVFSCYDDLLELR